MRQRAADSVYWPGLNSDLRKIRSKCSTCNEIAPSQSKEPLILLPQPNYPFEQICADYMSLSGHNYLSVVDRYSGWPIIYHYPHGHPTSAVLISNLRSIFATYGTPKMLFSDGGPQFKAIELNNFLTTWGVQHEMSSAGYPQSNGRAELAVKTAKRILEDNIASDGSLNCDRACRALLQYRNTPLQNFGLSPAQILFHRQLHDCIPTSDSHLKPHSSWLKAAADRERAFYQRNQRLISEYNRNCSCSSPTCHRIAGPESPLVQSWRHSCSCERT